VRAAVRLARGDADAAADDADRAVTIQRTTGYRAGEAHARGISRACGRSVRNGTAGATGHQPSSRHPA
jgi:hypothetical protein